MTEYRSLADTKAHLSEIVDLVESLHEHVVITRRGEPAAVLLSTDEYEGLIETLDILSRPEVVEEIRRADAEIDAGQYFTAAEIRAKYLKDG